MKLLCLSAADLRAALPMRDAIEAVKDAFAALSTGRADAPPRTSVAVPPGNVTLMMGARVDGLGLATKVVSVFPRNRELGRAVVSGLVVVLDPETGEPTAICDGTFLTAWRTGAASGVATLLLAREDASVAAIVGCGNQARTQVLAIDCVRTLATIRVFDRDAERAQAFADAMQTEVQARLEVAPSADDAVRGADVVCTATTSPVPVFDGAALVPGTHVNAVGSFTLETREVDDTTVRRARVFIDSLESALDEAGDLVLAESAGATRREEWTELGLVAAGKAPGRSGPEEITFFKSVGHAVQDVATAARAVRVARERGLGRELVL
ncbi:MAG: ornithine cyclodeaminase [Planctomycetota bacterium]|nr:MAG: ornithine cyclodeaminase [Planctomycetota bacterium]